MNQTRYVRYVNALDAMALRHDRSAVKYASEIRVERAGVTETTYSRAVKLIRWGKCLYGFYQAMLKKLVRVKHKRDWRGTSLPYRMHRLREEMLEAHEAFEAFLDAAYGADVNELKRCANRVMDELVDVGNTAMIAREYFLE